MKIGLLTHYSKEVMEFLVKNGFKSMELQVGPGTAMDLNTKSKDELLRVKDDILSNGIEISAISYYSNNLNPDLNKRKANLDYLNKMLDLAVLLDVKTICTFAGRDPERSIQDNIPVFKEAFTPLVKKAEDLGVKIGFENCPMFHYHPFRGINIAYTPVAWDLMFDAIPSDNIGIEYDPSHLICLLIDYIEIIYRYGKRIFHVHAKDGEVIWRNVKINGILEPGAVRHRTPGLGQVDWGKLISALVENGYRGNLDIEGMHDPVFSGELEETGLIIALKHLSQFVKEKE